MNNITLTHPPLQADYGSNQPYLIPLTIGVTGHRDLRTEDLPQLEARVREILVELQTTYPQTPLQLLSLLAEGADRLAARVAADLGVTLIVPLPMAQAEYERDFTTAKSLTEFRELLQQATRVFELPLSEESDLDAVRDDPEKRAEQYQRAGFYIAQQSQILIALWDGVATHLTGGTSNVVGFKTGDAELHAMTYGQNPWWLIDSGPVYHILTPRRSNPQPAGELLQLTKRFPSAQTANSLEAEAVYTRMLERLGQYNRDVLQHLQRQRASVEQSKDYLVPQQDRAALPKVGRSLLDQYAAADALAIANQRKRRRTMIGLFSLAVVAVIFLEISDWIKPWEGLLPMYLLAFLAAFVWHYYAKSQDYQNKHLDYRALAEGLRVQFFWELTGIRANAADHYLTRQRNELEWIRYAIRSCSLLNLRETQSTTIMAVDFELARQRWVYSEWDFFIKTARRDRKKKERQEWLVKLLLGIGFGLVGVLIYNLYWPLIAEESLGKALAAIVIHVAPVAAAAFLGYAEKMAVAEQSRRYVRMSSHLTRIANHLDYAMGQNDWRRASRVLLTLGEEMLIENGDWVLLHREKPMEVPIG